MYQSSLRKLLVSSTLSFESLGRFEASWMMCSMIMVLSSVQYSPFSFFKRSAFRVFQSRAHR